MSRSTRPHQPNVRILQQPEIARPSEARREKTKRILSGRLHEALTKLQLIATVGEQAHNYDIRDSDAEKLEAELMSATRYAIDAIRNRGRARRVEFED